MTLAVALEQGGELCVCDLAWILERRQKLVSHHLRVLREAGLAWLDPAAALVVAAVAAKEGRESWRGEGCSAAC